MGRKSFEEWLREKERGSFLILERRVNRARFEEWCIPQILEKVSASRFSWVRNREEWEEKRKGLLLPALFPEKEVVFLEGIDEGLALKIARESPSYSLVFFFFLPEEELTRGDWRRFPWIVLKEEGVFELFLKNRLQALGLFLEEEARVCLFRLLEEYELQETDIEAFLRQFRRGERIKEKDVEVFFEQSERALLFRFLDAVGERNASLALQYGYRLLGKKFPPALFLSHLARRFRLLLQLYLVEEKRKDLWQKREISSFEMQKIQKMQAHFSLPDILRIFQALQMADRLLKTQSIDPQAFLLSLITEIVGPKKSLD
ncbi:MAG: hypothetical protein ACUVTO_07845 [Candidatus Caldatribacteriaceae bacterium]